MLKDLPGMCHGQGAAWSNGPTGVNDGGLESTPRSGASERREAESRGGIDCRIRRGGVWSESRESCVCKREGAWFVPILVVPINAATL